MLTPEQIDALSELSQQAVEPVIEFLLDDIARRIAEAGQFTSTASYQIWRAQTLGLSRKDIEKELQKRLNVSQEELEKLLMQSAEVGYSFDLNRLGVEGVPFAKNESLQQIVSAAKKLADENFYNVTQTLGFVNPFGKAVSVKDAYVSCCDFVFYQVSTGAADYNTAIRQAIKNLSDKGVRSVDYKSGRHYSLEAAVRQSFMGGLGLMQEQISQMNHDKLGADGWEISAHAASAPDHEPIQGRQYSDKDYNELNNSLERRIGTLNCGHAAFPIILGVSQPQYTPEQLEQFKKDNEKGVTYNGKHYTSYEATQKQRAIERAIRRQKRRVLAAEASGDKDALLTSQVRLRSLNEEYRRYSKAVKLPAQYQRAEAAGFSLKQANEAAKGANKYYKQWSKSIGVNDSVKTLEDYYEMKYNRPEEYRLLKGYVRAVEKQDIDTLTGFEQYMKTANEISDKIVGQITSEGVVIESFTTHFIDRTIGQCADPHKGMRQGTPVDYSLDALLNPVKPVKIQHVANDDIRQVYYGKKAKVVISVRDKKLIQANLRSEE